MQFFEKRTVALMVAVALLAGIFGAALGFGFSRVVTATPEIEAGALSIVQIAQNAADTVVEITTETIATDYRMQQYVAEGAGSGVILREDGLIVTNNHVIDGAQKLIVRLRSGEEYEAKLVGRDAVTDLAVIKIDAKGLKTAVLGDSDALVVGETAVAIGNPLGSLGGTVTEGIISAKDRQITIDNQEMTLIQTTAAINPGNSGGGLFSDKGALIGIVNAKSSGSGIEGLGFAIPANLVFDIVSQLVEKGYISGRPALGVSVFEQENRTLPYYFGVPVRGLYVKEAKKETPFLPWDRILSVDAHQVSTYTDLSAALSQYKIGDKVKVKIIRNYEVMTLDAPIIELKPF